MTAFVITVCVSLAAAFTIRQVFINMIKKIICADYFFTDEQSPHDLEDISNRAAAKRGNASPLDLLSIYRNLLGLGPRFSREELKNAYRNNAAMYHPDRFISASRMEQENAENQMKKINEAYEFLKNFHG